MVFKGVYPALDLRPTEFGLFSAAQVTESSISDEQWVRGFSFEFDSRPTLRLCDETGAAAHEMFDGTGLPRFLEVKSFYIEVEDYHSTFAANNEDRFARVIKQLKAATQKAVERELMDGYVARSDGNDNHYLAMSGVTSMASATPATAVPSAEGVALLEFALSNSPTGEQGVLHLTRDVAASLGSQWLLMRVEDDPGKFHVETINGTTAVTGSGYTGDGPIASITFKRRTGGDTAHITTGAPHYLSVGETVRITGVDASFDGEHEVTAVDSTTEFHYASAGSNMNNTAVTDGYAQMIGSAATKWIYCSSAVGVLLGEPVVVNESLAQGYDVNTNQNNLRIKALRPAAVYFDPSMTYAVKVDVS